jgi:hypothetical protein
VNLNSSRKNSRRLSSDQDPLSMICLYRESDHKNKKEKELSWLAGSVAMQIKSWLTCNISATTTTTSSS